MELAPLSSTFLGLALYEFSISRHFLSIWQRCGGWLNGSKGWTCGKQIRHSWNCCMQAL